MQGLEILECCCAEYTSAGTNKLLKHAPHGRRVTHVSPKLPRLPSAPQPAHTHPHTNMQYQQGLLTYCSMGDRVAYVVPNKRCNHVQGGALHMGGAACTNVLQETGHLYQRRSSAQVDFLDTFLNHRL
jgi:hypothetical protein